MLKAEILEFAQSLGALRDFVDLIAPFLDERHKEIARIGKPYLAPAYLAMLKALPKESHIEEMTEDKIRQMFNGEIDIEEEPKVEDDGKRTFKLKIRGSDAEKFRETIMSLQKTEHQKALLYQSSLMNLTNTVEWFMSQIIHRYFETYPDAVGSDDNVFSLNDLKAFGTVEDAKRYLIETKVENILRGSFDEWIKFLKEKAKLGAGYLDKKRDKLAEVYQRRNIIVHNGGVINSIYLSKVSPEFKKDKNVGDLIEIPRSYLDSSIGLFEQTFILVAAEMWSKQSGTEVEIADLIISIAFEHLLKERWSVAEGLSYFVMSGKELPELTILFAQLNYWQSIKWQGRYEEIKGEVENADFSGKGLVAQLALFALTDKVSEFFEILPEVITDNVKPELTGHKITYTDLQTWPIFREIRKDPLYEKFREEHASEFEVSDETPPDKVTADESSESVN